MSNNMSVMHAALLQRQLDIILKPHGHAGGLAPVGQKFADVAEAQFGIPFAIPQAFRATTPLRKKRDPSKDRGANDQARDGAEDSLTDKRRPQRNPDRVDVRV